MFWLSGGEIQGLYKKMSKLHILSIVNIIDCTHVHNVVHYIHATIVDYTHVQEIDFFLHKQ